MIEFKFKDFSNRIERSLHVTARKAVERSVKLADKAFRVNTGLRCHSLKDLAAMDHPYATRHGGTGQVPHNPYWLIHTQSGELRANSIMEPILIETSDSVVGNFGFKPDQKPIMLVGGTSRMIPRPVVWGTLGMVKGPVVNIFREEFGKRFGGNVSVNVGAL